MESPVWHAIGVIGALGFAIMIVLILLARSWFASNNPTKVKLGALVLIYLGGPSTARSVEREMQRRKTA